MKFMPTTQSPAAGENAASLALPLEWHKGPANGGEGTAGGHLWWDGDVLLAIVETSHGRDFEVVRVSADEGYAELLINEDDAWGWSVDDVSWWAKLDSAHLPPVSKGGAA